MRVIDVARKLGYSADWIRRLERDGVIPPARRDFRGHRRYTEADVKALADLIFGQRDHHRAARPLRDSSEEVTNA